MFCSTDCKINAICEYHGIECMLPKHVKEASGVLRTFRPLFIALSLFDGDFNTGLFSSIHDFNVMTFLVRCAS